MACPFNIKVIISELFCVFPHDYVKPQHDVGNALLKNLIVYVPTENEIQYIKKNVLLKTFNKVLIYRHESLPNVEARSPKKNNEATIVYWNPIKPITEVGVGETREFSILLTNNLYYCNTMIVDTENRLCPIEYHRSVRPDSFRPIAGEDPLFYSAELLNDDLNDFLICFNLETSVMVKILNVKRILTMLAMRRVTPARYALHLPDKEVNTIYNTLEKERVRRLVRGGKWDGCMLVNRAHLNYIRSAQELLGIGDHARSTKEFIKLFQPLIAMYGVVPDIIVKLNTLEKQKKIRLYCKNDSYATTSFGLVPNNMCDVNTYKFNYSDINNSEHLYNIKTNLFDRNGVYNVRLFVAHYNYFF